MSAFIYAMIFLFTMMLPSYADNSLLQEQLNTQKKIMELQSKRIDELEFLIKEFQKNLPKKEDIKDVSVEDLTIFR